MTQAGGSSEVAVVERPVTLSVLEAEAVSLGPKEARALRLPEHSDEIKVTLSGREYVVEWNARSRSLGGEALASLLVEESRLGDLIRLTAEGASFHIHIVARHSSALRIGSPGPVTTEPAEPAVHSEPRKRRSGAAADKYRIRRKSEFDWIGDVGILKKPIEQLREALGSNGWDDPAAYELRMRGEALAAVSGFEELLSAELARVDQMPHQYSAALTVLAKMQGRAILADEVGLGKTIEAGLITKELLARGLAKRILVICPVPLREQWAEELADKFDIEARIVTSGYDSFAGDSLIIGSQLAVRNADQLTARKWDVLILDEAHRGLSGKKTQAMLKDLCKSTRYVLFLTATPVQNSLLELHQLVETLRPGTFSSKKEFRQSFCSQGDQRTPADPSALREILADVMVRTTRGQAGLDRVQRHVKDTPVRMTRAESSAYKKLLGVLRSAPREQGDHLRLQQWGRRLVLSPRSLALSLLRSERFEGALAKQVESVAHASADEDNSRQKAFLELVRKWVQDPDKGKVVVFTQQVDVAQDLIRLLDREGIASVSYFGAQVARQRSLKEFKGQVPVMVATEAGAEGLNLQFANCVINYDLPWNPMRIEQRIGRVDRLTQTRDVHVANMFSPSTVEDRIYSVLRNKLKMFELLFGQITLVLGELDDKVGASLESQIATAILGDEEIGSAFDRLDSEAVDARAQADEQIGVQAGLSGWMVGWDDSHRKGLTRAGDDTLLPQQQAASRERQQRVIQFVDQYLRWAGAEVVIRSEAAVGNEDEARQVFLTADLPEELQSHFGGVDRLHLAFHPSGLDQHPNAELCAAGSDVFEEIVDSVRVHGDLLIEEPVVELPDNPLLAADEELTYAGRVVHGAIDWHPVGTWLLRLGGARGSAEILVTGEDAVPDLVRVAVSPSNSRPSLLSPARALKSLAKTASRSAADRGEEIADSTHADQMAAYEQLTDRRHEQLSELESDISSARDHASERDLVRRYNNIIDLLQGMQEPRRQKTDTRLELLGAKFLGGQNIRVTETWTDRNDHPIELDLAYNLVEREVRSPKGSDGEPVRTVSTCDGGHVIDIDRRRTCAECSTKHCEACEDASYRSCAVCSRAVCPECIGDTGLCLPCGSPTRWPHGDSEGLSCFQLGGEKQLLLGVRCALIDGEPVEGAHLSSSELSDLFALHGLGPDTGLRFERFDPGATDAPSTFLLRSDKAVVALPDPEPHNRIDADALAALDVDEPAQAATLHSFGHISTTGGPTGLSHGDLDPILDVIAALRDQISWQPSGLLVREHGSATFLTIDEQGPALATASRGADGHEDLELDASASAITWRDQPVRTRPATALIKTAEVLDAVLDLERIHRSHVLHIHADGESCDVFIPVKQGTVFEEEARLADLRDNLDQQGPPGLGWVAPRPCPEPVTNSQATLATRAATPVVILSSQTTERPACVGDVQTLWPGGDDIDQPTGSASHAATEPGWRSWVEKLDQADSAESLAITQGYRVVETWTGDSEATAEYVVEGGMRPVSPVGEAIDFWVDRSGHFVARRDAIVCGSCGLHSCDRCPNELAVRQCNDCGQPSCGTCADSDPVAAAGFCGTCGEVLCGSCGRAARATTCALCSCALCSRHGRRQLCGSCETLAEADPHARSVLPEHLNTHGHLVLTGIQTASSDSGGKRQVVVIAGGARREIAVIDGDQHLVSWTSYADESPIVTRFEVAAARSGPVDPPRFVIEGPVREIDEWTLAHACTHAVTAEVGTERDVLSGEGHGWPSELDLALESLPLAADDGPQAPQVEQQGIAALENLLSDFEIPAGRPCIVRCRPILTALQIHDLGLGVLVADPSTEKLTELGWTEAQPGRVKSINSPWSVEMEALGNALSLEVTTTKGVETTLAIPLGSNVDEQWLLQRLREDLDVPSGELVTGSDDDPDLIQALAGLDLVSRVVAPFIAVTSINRQSVQLGRDQLELSGTDYVDTRPPSGTPDRIESADSHYRYLEIHDRTCSYLLGKTGPRVPIGRRFKVEDTWVGHGSAEVRYEVGPGEMSPTPRLDEPTIDSWNFSVDVSNHLVGLASVNACKVCGAHTCRLCNDDKGVGACTACGQQACGVCRHGDHRGEEQGSATPQDDDDHRCADCSSVLCRSCGRMDAARRCGVCLRHLCFQCRSDTCQACTNLSPSEGELPTEIGAVRADHYPVMWSSHNGATVVMIGGGLRAELAVFEGGSLRTWRDYSGLSRDEWLTVFEASRRGSATSISVVDTPRPPPMSSAQLEIPEALRLQDDAVRVARLALGDEVIVDQSVLPDSSSTLAHLAETAPLVQTPSFVKPFGTPTALRERFVRLEGLRAAAPSGEAVEGVLTIESNSLVTRRWVDSRGIVTHHGLADDLSESIASFTASDVTPTPGPVEHAEIATVEGHTAIRAHLGPVVLLGVGDASTVEWTRVDRTGVDPLAVLVGVALTGRHEAVEVSACSLPERTTPLQVANAQLRSREVSLAPRESDSPPAPEGVRAIASHLSIDLPEVYFAAPPNWSSLVLEGVPASNLKTLDVGLQFSETWAGPSGEFDLQYDLAPGELVAANPSYDTNVFCNELWVDRSLHMVESVSQCPYCDDFTCALCEAPTVPCYLCGILRCGRCGPTPDGLPLCEACSDLNPTDGLTTLRRRGIGGHRWVGSDRLHEVEVVDRRKDSEGIRVETRGEALPEGLTRESFVSPQVLAAVLHRRPPE